MPIPLHVFPVNPAASEKKNDYSKTKHHEDANIL